jgi:hypothetical protein
MGSDSTFKAILHEPTEALTLDPNRASSQQCSGNGTGKNCYLLAVPVHARPALFIGRIRGRLGLKELGQLSGGIHHLSSASPFVVSLNGSRTIAPSLKRFRLSKRNYSLAKNRSFIRAVRKSFSRVCGARSRDRPIYCRY